ncbi:phage tail protein [Pectobacterium polonicum]|uniref:Phage tail protein n=1 Tax=Pectobacterium polonicum TaxID=2485124 RepID=A0AAE9T282_9GAMM|nr:phage tail protein [Pectobacterium polonicum]UVO09277.1 phage tail protein [Pectobacterium polonicum]
MWGAPVPPEGWLELNGQLFNPSGNPVLPACIPPVRYPTSVGIFHADGIMARVLILIVEQSLAFKATQFVT